MSALLAFPAGPLIGAAAAVLACFAWAYRAMDPHA